MAVKRPEFSGQTHFALFLIENLRPKVKYMTKHKPPRFINTAFEAVRTSIELINSCPGFACDLVSSRSHDAQDPVMVLPATFLHDMTTYLFRKSISSEGYKTYDSNTGFNLGFVDKMIKKQEERVGQIIEGHEDEKVSLIGHSLGGVQSLLLAYRYPENIGSVITLGSPLGTVLSKSGVSFLMERAYFYLDLFDMELVAELSEYMKGGPPNAPVISIYSHYDGIASAEAAKNPWAGECEGHKNIEIPSRYKQSHVGMICSKHVISVVKNQLNQNNVAASRIGEEYALI